MGIGFRWLPWIAPLLVGCAGSGKADPCEGVTCAPGRACVLGRCLDPDARGAFAEAGVGLEVGVGHEASAKSDGRGEASVAVDLAAGDHSSPCPDPKLVAGSYTGDFVDGLGGSLAKGKVAFTLQASGAQALTLAGTIDGLALPGIKNYSIKATLTGGVTCAALTAALVGKLDGYAFDGQLTGTLGSKTAVGLWNGTQAGGGITAAGTWSANRN